MRADELLARRAVDAVDLVVGDVGMDPLDFGAELAQHAARALRGSLELVGAEAAGARHLPLDHELRHGLTSWQWRATSRVAAPKRGLGTVSGAEALRLGDESTPPARDRGAAG